MEGAEADPVEHLAEVLSCPQEQALFFWEAAGRDFQTAVNMYYEHAPDEGRAPPPPPPPAPPTRRRASGARSLATRPGGGPPPPGATGPPRHPPGPLPLSFLLAAARLPVVVVSVALRAVLRALGALASLLASALPAGVAGGLRRLARAATRPVGADRLPPEAAAEAFRAEFATLTHEHLVGTRAGADQEAAAPQRDVADGGVEGSAATTETGRPATGPGHEAAAGGADAGGDDAAGEASSVAAGEGGDGSDGGILAPGTAPPQPSDRSAAAGSGSGAAPAPSPGAPATAPSPDWVASGWRDAASAASASGKLLFAYLHSSTSPSARSFAISTLLDARVVAQLDARYLCWGGDVRHSDARSLAGALGVRRPPHVALLSLEAGRRVRLVAYASGQTSPRALLDLLLRAGDEHAAALARAGEGERRAREARALREEQDEQLARSIEADRAREARARAAREEAERAERAARDEAERAESAAREETEKEARRLEALAARKAAKATALGDEPSSRGGPGDTPGAVVSNGVRSVGDAIGGERGSTSGRVPSLSALASAAHLRAQATPSHAPPSPPSPAATTSATALLRLRLPSGATAQRRFRADDALQAVFDWADALPDNKDVDLFSIANPFPRRVYGDADLSLTIAELGLVPQAALLFQPLDE